MSSVLFKGRAALSEIADIQPMLDEGWRERLSLAIDKSGTSMRQVSLGAGLGAGYIHSIVVEGKDPTITNLVRVCDFLGVSLWYILHGHNLTAQDEELLQMFQKAPDAEKESLLQLLRSRRST